MPPGGAPFWRHFRRLEKHHFGGAAEAPFSSAVTGGVRMSFRRDWRRCRPCLLCASNADWSSIISGAVFRRSRRRVALFFRHFRCRWEAPVLGSVGVRSRCCSGIILPPFRRRVGATDSHRYGVILTLILVIGGCIMASFGGVSPAATCRSKMVPVLLLTPLSVGC